MFDARVQYYLILLTTYPVVRQESYAWNFRGSCWSVNGMIHHKKSPVTPCETRETSPDNRRPRHKSWLSSYVKDKRVCLIWTEHSAGLTLGLSSVAKYAIPRNLGRAISRFAESFRSGRAWKRESRPSDRSTDRLFGSLAATTRDLAL